MAAFRRFHTLMVAIASTSSTASASPNRATTASHTSSLTPSSSLVSSSVRASAARSASLNHGASCQAATENSRRWSSPAFSASVLCMSTQNEQPFRIDARSFTSSSTSWGSLELMWASNP
jgi:hypothetical protein